MNIYEVSYIFNEENATMISIAKTITRALRLVELAIPNCEIIDCTFIGHYNDVVIEKPC